MGPCLQHCYHHYGWLYLLLGFVVGVILCYIMTKNYKQKEDKKNT